jgi:AraC family transcriptional regulator
LTDISVGEYVRRRRLSLAAQELSRSNSKIIDLALKYGYDTPEAFSKAIRRQHGVSPTDVRNGIGKLKIYNRLIIQVSLKGAEPVQYKIFKKNGFQVTRVKREFSLVNEENLKGIPKMWGDVHKDGTNDLLIQLNNGPVKGVLGVCVEKKASQSMDYWIAAAHTGETPEKLLKLEIPAAKWAVFEVPGPMPDGMQKAWKQIFPDGFQPVAFSMPVPPT